MPDDPSAPEISLPFRLAAGWVRRDLWLGDWRSNRAIALLRTKHRTMPMRVVALGLLPQLPALAAVPWALSTVAHDPWFAWGVGPWLFLTLLLAGIASVTIATGAWVARVVAHLPKDELRLATVSAAEAVQAIALPPMAMTPMLVITFLSGHATATATAGWAFGAPLGQLIVVESLVLLATWLVLRPLAEAAAAFSTRAHLFLHLSSTATTRSLLDLTDIAWPMLGIIVRVVMLAVATLWLVGWCAAPRLEPDHSLPLLPFHDVVQAIIIVGGLWSMYLFSRPDARRLRRRTAAALEFCWNEAGEWWGGDNLSDWCMSPEATSRRATTERELLTPWQPRDL